MSRENAQAALATLGERLGIPGLRLSPEGICQLVFEQRWAVTLVHDAALHQLVLHCPLCAPAQASALSAATLRGLLQANFMGQGCGGGQLAMAPDERIYLQWTVALADAASLDNALESLLNQAERWSQRLQAGDPPAAAADPAPHPPVWAMQKV